MTARSRCRLLATCALVLTACASAPEPYPPIRSTESAGSGWVDVRRAEGFNWSGVAKQLSTEVGRIDRVLRNRAVYRIEGLAIGHLMLGPGALYPYHSHASPEAYHVLSGEAEWSVDGETRRVGPGTSIYHAPYANHRWVTTSSEPLRVLWAQWVPDGDRTCLLRDAARRRGGSSTGSFVPGERRSRSVLVTRMRAPVADPEPGGVIESMALARSERVRAEPERPAIRAFVDAVGVPWNREIPGVRWRAVFGTPDLEWGHAIVSGPAIRRIPAGASPGVIHVLSGRARIRVGEEGVPARAGTTVAFGAGEPITIDFEAAEGETPEPLRAFWVRWAPGGDLSYWARDYFLVEPMPEPPGTAALPRDVPFFAPD